MDDIYEQLTDILHDVFDDDDLVARPGMTANEVAGWDSFAHLRLIMAVEKRFGVKFSAAQIASLQNVGDLALAIHAKR